MSRDRCTRYKYYALIVGWWGRGHRVWWPVGWCQTVRGQRSFAQGYLGVWTAPRWGRTSAWNSAGMNRCNSSVPAVDYKAAEEKKQCY